MRLTYTGRVVSTNIVAGFDILMNVLIFSFCYSSPFLKDSVDMYMYAQ